MSNPAYIDNKEGLLNRLHRIAGQVGGLARMVDEERYCVDILTQISAAQAALDQVALSLLDDHARHCMVDATKNNREQMTDELMGAVSRLIRSR